MTKEKRALFDCNGKATKKFYCKGEDIPKGYYPMVVMVCIQNSSDKFLMQRRSVSKGGDWGVTGGHVNFEESPDDALIREVKEELGVDIEKKPILFSYGCDGKDCFNMYYVKQDIDLSKVVIQKEELSDVKWFCIEELEEMVNTKELNNDQVSCFKKCLEFLKNKNQ